jgi:hypothetical protein
VLKIGVLSLLKPAHTRYQLCQISLRVHVKADAEYHSQAYAVRMMADKTEFLIADQSHKLFWIDIARVEAVE